MRLEDADGQPLSKVTIRCSDEDDSEWVVRTLSEYLKALESISAPGAHGEITWQWMTTDGEVVLNWVTKK